MKTLWIICNICWIIIAFFIGDIQATKSNNKNWEHYLADKIVVDIPKGSILLKRSDGNFLVGRIDGELALNNIENRYKENKPIELVP